MAARLASPIAPRSSTVTIATRLVSGATESRTGEQTATTEPQRLNSSRMCACDGSKLLKCPLSNALSKTVVQRGRNPAVRRFVQNSVDAIAKTITALTSRTGILFRCSQIHSK
jgi:hypothetical protein